VRTKKSQTGFTAGKNELFPIPRKFNLLTEMGTKPRILKNSNYENLKLITGLLVFFFRVF
jgi:hypothetical protein